MSAYYKTNHPDVMAAVAIVREQQEALRDAGKAFADKFGGKPFHLRSSSGTYFGGLIFSPKRDITLWTVPDKHGAQSPRAKPRPNATEAQKAEHKTLLANWKAMFPKGRISPDPIYAAIGTSWGETLFGGIGYAERDGWLYVDTGAKLNDRMTEILGSEFAKATSEQP